MPKTKLGKLHKIRIHHNRWLIWAIVYVLLVGLALVYYVKISDLNIDAENTSQDSFAATRTYGDKRLGFTVKYPTSWSIEADSKTSVNFAPDTQDEGVSVNVVSPDTEKSLRASLKIVEEDAIYIDNVPAKQITNDLGKGNAEIVVFATYNHNLYVIRGSERLVARFLQSFHFISN